MSDPSESPCLVIEGQLDAWAADGATLSDAAAARAADDALVASLVYALSSSKDSETDQMVELLLAAARVQANRETGSLTEADLNRLVAIAKSAQQDCQI